MHSSKIAYVHAYASSCLVSSRLVASRLVSFVSSRFVSSHLCSSRSSTGISSSDNNSNNNTNSSNNNNDSRAWRPERRFAVGKLDNGHFGSDSWYLTLGIDVCVCFIVFNRAARSPPGLVQIIRRLANTKHRQTHAKTREN